MNELLSSWRARLTLVYIVLALLAYGLFVATVGISSGDWGYAFTIVAILFVAVAVVLALFALALRAVFRWVMEGKG